ncbi:EmrB/QacA subfamily drug resistance transporter [Candidatus Protofrankia californiensis]|uniref:EmrB/QacA subfamily drug resistance transporter n=1 Tax=Candidatus Protofrankia californiensis TaxID=1839754 RepID=A0A1C3NYM7_9ACTN|nr:EmrB/QacA subfamily drug resistance transporter [Candidatus Protofrankia californiensis]
MTAPPALPKFLQQLILAVLMVCSLLIWLDNTVLSITLETLADPVRGLGASPAELQWATGAYTLVFATLMFTAGALGDSFGHRNVLAVGLVVFGAASIWAACAGDAGQLIAARAAMGVGAALIMPANFAILLWTFTGPGRATAIAISSTSTGVGMAAGPVLAGVLLSHFWWGSVFLVNVPIVVVALAGIVLLVPNFRSSTVRPLDPAGILLSISGLAALTYGLIRAGQVDDWSRWDVWAPIATGLVLLAVFVLVELRVKQPSFDPRLLAQRVFGGGNASMALLLFSVAAVTFYNAFYMQGALGFSPMKAGLANVPTAVGAVVGAPLGARLVRRWSLRPVAVPALAVAAFAMGAVGFLDLHTPLVWIEIVLLVQGLSVGMVLAPVTGALISSLPLEQSGAGSAVTNTARQAGSVIGIAVGGTIMSIAYRGAIEPSLSDVPGALQDSVRVSAEQARHVAATLDRLALTQAADHAFIHSMHVGAVWIMLIALVATAVLVFALRPVGRLTGSAQESDDGQGSGGSVAGVAPRTESDNQSTHSGADL